jgi:hypothetical protein
MKFLKTFEGWFSKKEKEKDYYGSKSYFTSSENNIETYKDLNILCKYCWVSKKLVNPILDILLDINKRYSLVEKTGETVYVPRVLISFGSGQIYYDCIVVSFSLQDMDDDYIPKDIANDIIEYVKNKYNSQGYKVVKYDINKDRVDFEVFVERVIGRTSIKRGN